MEDSNTEINAKKNNESIDENEKIDGFLTIGIVSILCLLVIYLSIGIFKYPVALGKTVLSFNSRDYFGLTYLDLLINSTPILTWASNDIDTTEVKKNVEDVFSKAAFIEKTSINNRADSASAYSSYIKLINDESKNYPLIFPVIGKILFKNTLSFSNDSLFFREIVNRCKNDAEVQFFCDNVIGSIQYFIVAHNSEEKKRKWYGEILGYFSNKYIDFLSSIFMDYTGYVAKQNVNNNVTIESSTKEDEEESLNDVAEDTVEVIDSIKVLKEATASIVANSIQAYQSKKKENVENSPSDAITNEQIENEEGRPSEIQDAQSLDLPEP